MSLSLAPVTVLHQDVYARLLATVKEFGESTYNVRAPIIVPFSLNATAFILTVDTPGIDVTIIVRKTGLSGQDTTKYTFRPSVETEQIELYLGEGSNILEIKSDLGDYEYRVNALHLATILEAQAQEIFVNTRLPLVEAEQAIFSAMGARLVEFYLPVQDQLPDVYNYRRLATKLAIRSMLQEPGSFRGVQDLLAALTMSTPIFVREKNSDTWFEPLVHPLFTPQEHFAGWDANIWLPNLCAARWLAYVKLLNNVRSAYTLEQVSEIIVTHTENTEEVRAQFDVDFVDSDCSIASLVIDCFDRIYADAKSNVNTSMMLLIGYPMDTVVEFCGALGFTYLDCEEVFDAGVLDSMDEVDKTGDGFVGYPLALRYDGHACFDTYPQEINALYPESCYLFGHAVTPLEINWSEQTDTIEIQIIVDASFSADYVEELLIEEI